MRVVALRQGQAAERRDKVLMIDARNIYRKVTRKIYDFSPEQLQNLTAIVWLYRGQTDRFLAPGPAATWNARLAEAAAHRREHGCAAFRQSYDALVGCRRAVPENAARRLRPLRRTA